MKKLNILLIILLVLSDYRKHFKIYLYDPSILFVVSTQNVRNF